MISHLRFQDVILMDGMHPDDQDQTDDEIAPESGYMPWTPWEPWWSFQEQDDIGNTVTWVRWKRLLKEITKKEEV